MVISPHFFYKKWVICYRAISKIWEKWNRAVTFNIFVISTFLYVKDIIKQCTYPNPPILTQNNVQHTQLPKLMSHPTPPTVKEIPLTPYPHRIISHLTPPTQNNVPVNTTNNLTFTATHQYHISPNSMHPKPKIMSHQPSHQLKIMSH